MDLTFQIPMQYCSLQHWALLLSPVTSTTGCCFCFGSISSFSLELFLHWSPVAYWAPADLGSSSFSVLSFCLFILFIGFSRQEYWSGLPFPSPVDHILSELFTMTCPSWVALHGMAHSFIELDKAVVHVIILVSFLWLWFSKGKGDKEINTHLNAEFQRVARRDKKAFLSDQCKEIEENNKMGKTRDLFKKIRDTKGTFHAKMGTIKDRNNMDLTEAEDIQKWQEYTEELYQKNQKKPHSNNKNSSRPR